MIIFMGPAGAGKSVQGNLLAKELGYIWVSTGDYLRSHLTEERKKQMSAGNLISDTEIIDIMSKCFEETQTQNGIIVDGFPRTIDQAKWLVQQHKKGNIRIKAVIEMEVSEDVAKDRLLGRGRDDDKEEVIKKRRIDYEKITRPIINWFNEQNITVYTIDADGTIDEVHQDISKKIGE